MGERTKQTLQAGSPGHKAELETHHSFPGDDQAAFTHASMYNKRTQDCETSGLICKCCKLSRRFY